MTSVAKGNNPNQNNASSGNATSGQTAVVRESPTKASTGLRESPTKASTGVSIGDVNGDGKADEIAQGHPSGKRQHDVVSITKTPDPAPKK